MNCYVCDKNEWHMLSKEFMGWTDREFGICKGCGNAAFHVELAEEEKIKDYYRKQYRGSIGPNNLITTSRKLNYVKNFIGEFLIVAETKNTPLIIADVGCSTGYLVDWFRRRGHKATGCEWTPMMRRFAEHFYGFPATEELTPTHKYDLIIMYHTFEHMIRPDQKLERYLGMLAEGGRLMISTPEWMNIIDQSGASKVESFRDLFHKDHINVFSRNSLKRLFKKFDLFIEKQDYITYGQTYLVRKRKDGEPEIEVEDERWEDVLKIVEAQKRAIEKYREALRGNKDYLFREALNEYPKFPDCYYDWVLNSTQKKDRGRCAELILEAMKLMPGDVKLHIIRAYFLYQNQEWTGALEDFNYIAHTKVNEDILMYRGYCLHHLGRINEAMTSFNEAALLNPQKWTEAMVWMCKAASESKSWDEVAAEKMKEKLFNEAKVQMIPKDPMFANDLPPMNSNGGNSNGTGPRPNEKQENEANPAK